MKKVQGNIIQIKPEEELVEKKTKGGLIIPHEAKRRDFGKDGIVVGIGNAPDFEFEVEVGDRVIFLASRKEEDEDGFLYVPHSEIVYIYDRG